MAVNRCRELMYRVIANSGGRSSWHDLSLTGGLVAQLSLIPDLDCHYLLCVELLYSACSAVTKYLSLSVISLMSVKFL